MPSDLTVQLEAFAEHVLSHIRATIGDDWVQQTLQAIEAGSTFVDRANPFYKLLVLFNADLGADWVRSKLKHAPNPLP